MSFGTGLVVACRLPRSPEPVAAGLGPPIFNLMKFDSYTRFLKSPLYQECILAEVEGRALPDSQQVPSSPASKHSLGSEHSSVSTPKKVTLHAGKFQLLFLESCEDHTKSRRSIDAVP
ncbi:hypothetical protein P7K49_005951 [Saguinus oedipus]|uniref:Uncharacterized protein n=1 Tax=Saguinus oedipus TaxID=9490 RepID=A0ABQ9W107_SAGOE|nr:hypothetical protein P7K49_005951 [Saguinus oedipus]